MLKHLESKRVCPKCGHRLHEHDYLMAREAEERVLSNRFIGWTIVLAAVLVAVVH